VKFDVLLDDDTTAYALVATVDLLTELLCPIVSRRLMHLDGRLSIVTNDARPASFDAFLSAAIKPVATPSLAHLILWVSGERRVRE
jgi:hypothetical protein